MQALAQWLSVATTGLCESAAERVRAEIGEHVASALESVETDDVDPSEVERRAVAALGDPEIANREYRRVLLTSGEEDLLRSLTGWWLSWGWLVLALFALLVAMTLEISGGVYYLMAMSVIEGALRIVPARSIRAGWIVRVVRWGVLTIGLTMAVVSYIDEGAGFAPVSVVVFCAGGFMQREYKLSVLRRKLPVQQWPRRLRV